MCLVAPTAAALLLLAGRASWRLLHASILLACRSTSRRCCWLQACCRFGPGLHGVAAAGAPLPKCLPDDVVQRHSKALHEPAHAADGVHAL